MMIKKKALFFLLLGLAMIALVFSGCDAAEEEIPVDEPEDVVEEEEPEEAVEEQVFTMEEIAQYDGQDGRPAYIVVDGVVYDVTDVPQWRGAEHFGFEAGTDVTEALADAAPHGAGQLDRAEIVGTVAE